MMKNIVSVDLETIYPIIKETLDAGNSFTFSPKGTSMLPLIRQGIDVVKISPASRKLRKYDVPLYRRDNGQFVLHRVVAAYGDCYVMCGDNQCKYEKGITDSHIIGLMTEIIRPDSVVSVDDKRYLRYSERRVKIQKLKSIIVMIKRFVKRLLRFLRLYK